MWGRKTSKSKLEKLPANVEHANREYVRNRLASWDDEILSKRADRLKVTREAASQGETQPLYLFEAEQRAHREGRTLESVLAEYAERLTRSTYPGPQCFLPDEITEYVEGTLSVERSLHADDCPGCTILLRMSKPEERAREALHDAMRVAGTETPFEMEVAASSRAAKATAWIPAIENWAGAVLVPGFALAVASLYLWQKDRSAAELTFVHSPLPWIVAALMAVVALLMFVAPGLHPLARSVGAGLAVGVVAMSFLVTDFRNSRATRDSQISVAQRQAESSCATFIGHRERTGEFLNTNQSVGGFQLDTARISALQATYVFTGKGIPGRVVCKLEANGGQLTWEFGTTESELSRLVTGTVHETDKGTTVKVADGQSYSLVTPSGLENISTGAHVVAALDRKTSAARSVRVLAIASQDKAYGSPAVVPEREIPE
jgi:hypothetical protein